MSDQMISFCGIDCEVCEARIATQQDDFAKLEALAAQWSSPEAPMTTQDVLCDGCQTEGQKCGWCNECPVRACAKPLGVENCAHCADYDNCKTLTVHFQMFPDSKMLLDSIRTTLN